MAMFTVITQLEREGKVAKTDEDENLVLYSYTHCEDSSDPILKTLRGIVFDKQGNLITRSFPYTDTITEEEKDKVVNLIKPTSKIFYLCEGSIIRVFFFANKWYITTQRKLRAIDSMWSSEVSFGNLFRVGISKIMSQLDDTERKVDEDMEEFLNKLDKNKAYFFVLKNTEENQIVCQGTPPTEPKIMFLASMKLGDYGFDFSETDFFISLGFSYFPKITTTDGEEVLKLLSRLDIKKCPGVIVFNGNVPTRVVTRKYLTYFAIRGNEVNISYRYLQIRKDKDQVRMLIDLYPEYKQKFDKIEQTLFDIASYLHKIYISRHCFGNFEFLPQEEHHVVEACHAWYRTNKQRVTKELVYEILNKQEPMYIKNMLEHYAKYTY